MQLSQNNFDRCLDSMGKVHRKYLLPLTDLLILNFINECFYFCVFITVYCFYYYCLFTIDVLCLK